MFLISIVALVTVAALGGRQLCVADCPDGWLNVMNEKCVKHFRHRYVGWREAQETCEIHGGDLLMILTRAERIFLL